MADINPFLFFIVDMKGIREMSDIRKISYEEWGKLPCSSEWVKKAIEEAMADPARRHWMEFGMNEKGEGVVRMTDQGKAEFEHFDLGMKDNS